MKILPEVAAVRRPFTDREIDTILARVDAARGTGELLAEIVAAVYEPLLADAGLSWQSLPADHKVDPRRFAVPWVQWQAIVTAVINRAAQWGTGAHLAVALVSALPSHYDDPGIAAPHAVSQLPDRRPELLELHVTRDAVDVIAVAAAHVHAITTFFGPASPQAQRAHTSWLAGLTQLLSMSLGADTHVRPDGRLSLLVTTGSGYVYGLTFHGDTRRCTAGDGCVALISDDGTAHTLSVDSTMVNHQHQPSFPLHSPRPGVWSMHS